MNNLPSHVILVHGLGLQPKALRAIARTLTSHGYRTHDFFYNSLQSTLTEAADQLYTVYCSVAESASTIHFVTHSMGGIVLRRLLARAPLPKLDRIAMTGPPNRGSVVARRLLAHPLLATAIGPAAQELRDPAYLSTVCALPTTPVLVIAGTRGQDLRNPVSLLSRTFLDQPSDGTVTIEETQLPQMARFVEVDECHTWLPSHPQTLREIAAFFGPANLITTTD
jgi:triacylglycerol lipase